MSLLLTGALGLLLMATAAGVLAKTSGGRDAVVNQDFGLRTKSTQHCDECWRVGHHAATPSLLLTALVSAALAIFLVVQAVLVRATGEVTTMAVLTLSGAYVISIGILLMATRSANEAARRVHDGNNPS